jgi:hypothetical protein
MTSRVARRVLVDDLRDVRSVRPRQAPSRPKCLAGRNDTDHFDFHGADFLDAEIIAVSADDFLGEITLDGIELGIGAHLQAELGAKLAPAALHKGAGGGDATHLFAASFQQTMERMAGDAQAALLVARQQQRFGLAQQNENGEQRQAEPQDDRLSRRIEFELERREVSSIGGRNLRPEFIGFVALATSSRCGRQAHPLDDHIHLGNLFAGHTHHLFAHGDLDIVGRPADLGAVKHDEADFDRVAAVGVLDDLYPQTDPTESGS